MTKTHSSQTNATKHPEIIMVIPTLGQRLDLLRTTLKSLKNQGENVMDIVVVCPLSNTLACKLASGFGATLVEDPGSISAAVNAGLAQATTNHKYLAWMGDDDLLLSNTINATKDALEANKKAVVAFGYCDYVDDNGRLLFTSRAGRIAPWLMTWGPNLVPLPGMLYRLSAIHQVGNFDETLKYAMDLDMLLRLRKQGNFLNTRQRVGAFRWHSTSTTVANRNASLNEAELVKRRYLNVWLQKLASLWEQPVRIATSIAAKKVSNRAKHLQMNE